MERYLWLVLWSRKLLNVTIIIYGILSIIKNFRCWWRIHIQEIELFLNTSMSPGEFLITIITNPFVPMFSHLCFRQMLDRSGSRSWKILGSLRNHRSEWNKSGFGVLLSLDLVLC